MNIDRKQTTLIIKLLAPIWIFLLLLMTKQVKMQQDDILEAPAVTQPLYSFTSHLLTTLNDGTKSESENIIVSPISIHKALNMVLLGADANTTTKRELLDTIGYSGLSDVEVEKCHEDYAKVLDRFEYLNKKALAAMKHEREEGETETHYQRRLQFGETRLPPMMDMFNMVITHNEAEVLPEYKTNVEKYYHSTVENVDDEKPETKTKIMEHLNSWGQEAGFDSPIMTQEELDKDFEAILLSAIRVQASWADKFRESKSEAIFYNHGLKDKPVNGVELSSNKVVGSRYVELTDAQRAQFKRRHEQLSKNSEAFRQLADLNCQIVQVPLDGGLTYTIFEPLEHSTPDDNKLNKLVSQLFAKTNSTHGAKLSEALQLLESNHGHVLQMELKMPKYRFEKELSLVAVLQSMGLHKAFDKRDAEISRMTNRNLCISDAKHQAMIEVNEKGIKAAGVTKMTMMGTTCVSERPEPLRVSIKKPFVFIIRYGKIPLFVGQLSSL